MRQVPLETVTVVLPEAFAPKPRTEIEVVRDVLSKYPAETFYMPGYYLFDDAGKIEVKDERMGACAACIIGWVASHNRSTSMHEHAAIRDLMMDAGVTLSSFHALINWGSGYELIPEFSRHPREHVPKAVLLEAFDRVVRGEKITA